MREKLSLPFTLLRYLSSESKKYMILSAAGVATIEFYMSHYIVYYFRYLLHQAVCIATCIIPLACMLQTH
jgi:hypothetical protein